jgi:hypothetical protein
MVPMIGDMELILDEPKNPAASPKGGSETKSLRALDDTMHQLFLLLKAQERWTTGRLCGNGFFPIFPNGRFPTPHGSTIHPDSSSHFNGSPSFGQVFQGFQTALLQLLRATDRSHVGYLRMRE